MRVTVVTDSGDVLAGESNLSEMISNAAPFFLGLLVGAGASPRAVKKVWRVALDTRPGDRKALPHCLQELILASAFRALPEIRFLIPLYFYRGVYIPPDELPAVEKSIKGALRKGILRKPDTPRDSFGWMAVARLLAKSERGGVLLPGRADGDLSFDQWMVERRERTDEWFAFHSGDNAAPYMRTEGEVMAELRAILGIR